MTREQMIDEAVRRVFLGPRCPSRSNKRTGVRAYQGMKVALGRRFRPRDGGTDRLTPAIRAEFNRIVRQ